MKQVVKGIRMAGGRTPILLVRSNHRQSPQSCATPQADHKLELLETQAEVRDAGNSRWLLALAALCVIVGFRSEIFFSLAGVMGFEYGGAEEDGVYTLFVMGASILVYLAALHMIFTARHVNLRQLLVVLLPVFFVVAFLADSALGRLQPPSYKHFLLALAFASPAAAAGMLCAQKRIADRIAYVLEPLILLLTVAGAISAVSVLTGSSRYGGVGGASYQTASYLGALAFNCNLYYFLFGRTGMRPGYSRNLAYRATSLVLLPLQLAGVLVSGGRGAFVLVAVGAVVQLGLLFSSSRTGRQSRLVLFAVACVPLLVWIVPAIMANENAARRALRVFSYVGVEGIDWSGTSGRDEVYSEALMAIESQGVFGHGFFSWGLNNYPHNLLLELVLNGGFLYASLWVFVLGAVSVRAVRIFDQSREHGVLVPLLLYPLVMLQFSGSYMTSGPLWFCMAFSICASRKVDASGAPRGSISRRTQASGQQTIASANIHNFG